MGKLQKYNDAVAVEEALDKGKAAHEALDGHTVKSDVPENAVFTDTVYDDSEVKEDIEQNKTDILSLHGISDKFTSLNPQWTEGGYIRPTDGTICTFTSTENLRYYYSDKMRCDGASKITFNQYYRAAGGAVFYDLDGNFISGFDNVDGIYGDSITLDIPENAFYFAVTASTNTVTHEDEFPNLTIDVTTASIRKDILPLTQKVSEMYEEIPTIKTVSDKLTTYEPIWTEGGYISHVHGRVSSFTSTASLRYFYSNKLRCSNVNSITFEQYFSGSAGAAFYDADETFISGVVNEGNFGDIVTVEVPERACFFATTTRIDPITKDELYPSIKTDVTLESLGKSIFTRDEESALQNFAAELVSTNPLDHIISDGGYFETFRKFAVIGDSLASGEVYYQNLDNSYSGAGLYDYSWGSYIARMCGSEVVHFAKGGMTTRAWLSTYVGSDFTDNLAQAYFIGLQVNDRFPHTNPDTGISEPAVPLGSVSDINLSNRTQNEDTYYGNLASIIQYIKENVPKAKIFVITDPRSETGYNEAVRYMATIFDNVYIIDLYMYASGLYTTPALGDLWVHGHLTSIGYKVASLHILTLTDWIIRNNISEFKEVPYIVPN